MRVAALWRVAKPLTTLSYARGTSSQLARRSIVHTALRGWPNSQSVSGATTITSATDDPNAPTADLKTVGAESSSVLTIADVVSHRDAEFAQQGKSAPTCFDKWESIAATDTVQDAIDMMVECTIGSLIVTAENEGIVGIVTERDVLKKTSPRSMAVDQNASVQSIMSAHIMCIPTTTTVIDALATMTKENIRHLAVINGELSSATKKGSVPEEAMRCVLSIKDIVKAYAQFEAEKKGASVPPVHGSPPAVESVDASADPSPTSTTETTAPADPAVAKPDGETASPSTPPPPPSPPMVTAATMLKSKHRKIKLILNTRIEDNITVAEVVEEMTKHNFGSVLVVDKEQRVLGIFTERDYLTKVLYPKQDPTQVKVTDVCSKKLSCLQIEDTLERCWHQAAVQNFRHFPVIGTMRKDREKELAGILSIKDIVREISKDHKPQSGFRLMEFFMSKIQKEEVPPPQPVTPVQPTPEAAAVTTQDDEKKEKAEKNTASASLDVSPKKEASL